MKKILVVLLIIAIGVGLWIFIDHKSEEAFLQALYEEATDICQRKAEGLMKDKTIQVHSVDFDIKQIRPVVDGIRYVIYVDWYVDAEVYASQNSDKEYWMTLVSCTMPSTVSVNGQSITLTYMENNFNEGCTLIYNGSTMNGYEYHKDLTGKSDSETAGYSEVRCSRCGNSYRASSSFGLRVKKGQPCGVGGCGK